MLSYEKRARNMNIPGAKVFFRNCQNCRPYYTGQGPAGTGWTVNCKTAGEWGYCRTKALTIR